MDWKQKQIELQGQAEEKKELVPKGFVGEMALKIGLLTVTLMAIALAIYLASSVVMAIGHESEGFFRHISRLFRDAPYMLRSARGFGAFCQSRAMSDRGVSATRAKPLSEPR